MKRRIAAVVMATLSFPAIAAASRRAILNASADGPARYIVALNDDVDDISSVADELSRKHHGRLGQRFSRALRGFVIEIPEAGALDLLNEERVKYVEQDSMAFGGSTLHPSPLGTQSAPPGWGLDRIDQRDLPLNQTYVYATTGRGVTAYILDSGINATHVDFGGRVRNGFNFSATLPPADCNELAAKIPEILARRNRPRCRRGGRWTSQGRAIVNSPFASRAVFRPCTLCFGRARCVSAVHAVFRPCTLCFGRARCVSVRASCVSVRARCVSAVHAVFRPVRAVFCPV
jgi:hypothetical protein